MIRHDAGRDRATIRRPAGATRVGWSLAVAAAVLMGPLALGTAAADTPDDRLLDDSSALAEHVEQVMEPRVGVDTPGAVVVIVHGEQTLHLEGYGVADIDAGAPVSAADTTFRVGSVGKVATFTAVMRAAEEGVVDLDADVRRYLDDEVEPAGDGRTPITLRHLATHTAGFADPLDPGMVTDPDDLSDLTASLVGDEPARPWAPGEVTAYSNYGAMLAGHVVARAHGTDFDTHVRSAVFDPLGMTHATFAEPVPDHHPGRLAAPHTGGEGAFTRTERAHIAWRPAGSMSASGPDMAALLRAHLGSPADGETPILEPAGRERMTRLHHRPDPGVAGMAFGLWEHGVPGSGLLAHDGGTLGASSHLLLAPDEEVGIFVGYNVRNDDAPPAEVIDDLVEMLGLGGPSAPGDVGATADGPSAPGDVGATADGPSARGDVGATADGAAARAGQVAGEYRPAMLAGGGPAEQLVAMLLGLRVTADDGSLRVATLEDVYRFDETAPYVYRREDGDDTLSADVDDGRVEALHLSTMPMTSHLPVGPGRSVWLVGGLLVGSLALLLGSATYAVLAGVWRRLRRRPSPRAVGLTGWAGGAATLLRAAVVAWVGLLLAAFTVHEPQMVLSLQPWPLRVAFAGGYVIATLGVVNAVATALAWRRAGWSGRRRAHRTALALAGIALIWPLAVLGPV